MPFAVRLAFCGAPCGAIRGGGVFRAGRVRGENIGEVIQIPLAIREHYTTTATTTTATSPLYYISNYSQRRALGI